MPQRRGARISHKQHVRGLEAAVMGALALSVKALNTLGKLL